MLKGAWQSRVAIVGAGPAGARPCAHARAVWTERGVTQHQALRAQASAFGGTVGPRWPGALTEAGLCGEVARRAVSVHLLDEALGPAVALADTLLHKRISCLSVLKVWERSKSLGEAAGSLGRGSPVPPFRELGLRAGFATGQTWAVRRHGPASEFVRCPRSLSPGALRPSGRRAGWAGTELVRGRASRHRVPRLSSRPRGPSEGERRGAHRVPLRSRPRPSAGEGATEGHGG